jgi:hypothetical protein
MWPEGISSPKHSNDNASQCRPVESREHPTWTEKETQKVIDFISTLTATESHYGRSDARRLHLPANLTTSFLASMSERVERRMEMIIRHFSEQFRQNLILISVHKLWIDVVLFILNNATEATVGTQNKAAVIIRYWVHIVLRKQIYLVMKEEESINILLNLMLYTFCATD